MFKGRLFLTLSIALLLTCPSPVKAESSTSQILLTQEITQQSQTKRELIKQLLEVTGSRKLWDETLALNFSQIEENFSSFLPEIYNSSELSQEEQENLAIIQEKFTEIMAKFQTRFQEELSYDEILEKVYYPLYEKYYTEEDLRNILAFYETPTGKRTIEIMPQLVQESILQTNELMLPKMLTILQEIIEEEMRYVESSY